MKLSLASPTLILCAFFLLASCAPDTPAALSSPSSAVTVASTPGVTAAATPSVMPGEDCGRGDHFDEIESGGQVRQYLLHVPARYDPQEPAALVLVFHGAGIGAERFVEYTRFSAVSDREGFLIVYPQGLGDEPVWNPASGSRDVDFIRDLIGRLEARCRVDPGRIYVSGHSNGASMAVRAACELADLIAAAGPVSGAYSSGRCSPSRPVPLFAIHGTADPIVPYEGIPEWARAWAERNGCRPEPVEVVRNVLIREKRWEACEAGADVILYTVQDLGHDWPKDLIDVGQTIWDFFEVHSRDRGSS